MVILLSILLLLLLVYYGYKIKEGITVAETRKFIDVMGPYNQTTEKNNAANTKIDNTNNADNTLLSIKGYGITDKEFAKYLNDDKNPGANSESRLAYIQDVYTNRVNECSKYEIKNSDFSKLLRIIYDDSGDSEYKSNTDKVLAARELVKKDARFELVMHPENFPDDRDNKKLLDAYKSEIYAILQKENEC